jgi:hypothetical protein
MGPVDYQCQLDHSCYINLIELGLHVLGFFLAIILFIIVLGKLISVLYNLSTSIMFIHQAISVITSILRCFSFGMLDRDVVVEIEEGKTKKLSDKHYFIKKKLE